VKKVLLTFLSALCAAAQMVPRPAPDLETLGGRRGDVVVMAFMVTTCTHCQAVSRELESLYAEMKDRGLRVIGCVFDEGGDPLVFSRQERLSYPVMSVPRTTVEQFMGIAPGSRIGTPQLAFVDRKGMIRAQSAAAGSPLLQSPEVLRSLITALLKGPR
jgi:peroxiredoxin